MVSGVSPGTATISYTVTDANGCTTVVTADVTVANSPIVASILPATPNVCIGSTLTLTDATTGGVWSSSNTAAATITSSGVVTGVASGTSIISYTITTSCGGTASASTTITINAAPTATISYAGGPFCTSSAPVNVTFTGTTGGTYSSAAGLTIDATTGTITPSTSTGGAYTINYTVAASGGCAIYTATATVTITAAASATISYAGTPFCTSSAPVSVTRTGTAGGTYSSTAGLTINSSTGTITPATSAAGPYTITYTVAATGGCALFSTTASITITTAPSATISYAGGPSFCTSSVPVTVSLTGTAGGTYSSTTGLTINAGTGTITPSTSAVGTYLVSYSVTASGGCANYTATTSVTLTAAPTATAGTPVITCSNSGSVNITAGSSATNQSSVLWTSSGTAGTISSANSLTAATYTPSAADITAGSVTLTLQANGNAPCGAATSTKTVTITPQAVAPTITPSNPTICQGNIQPLSAGTSPTSGSPSFSSVIPYNNLPIPDYSLTGVKSVVPVAGIPAGAVINSVVVKFNFTHPYDGDLVINLKAPNDSVLNLVDLKGANGANFTNTFVSSLGSAVFTTNPLAAPFSGTFKADADYPVLGVNLNVPNVTAFTSLFGTPNGNWTLSALDLGTTSTGTLNNWTITINWTSAASPQSVIWSPVTDLYTDAAATIAYAGQSLVTVYAKPATPGSKVYTATSTGATCNNASTSTITVNPAPAVSIAADYCLVAGKVHLTATSIPAAATYTWSTGETTQSIDVDIAAVYKVTASLGSGCPGIATISVAQELVVNGDFTNGNTGFTSDYNYKPDVAGNNELVDDSGNNGYSVSTNGQNVHPNFWGRDHTSNAIGTRNFMLVNGHGNTLVVWKETVNVLPNTTYYFSAWAMSLNSAGNNAQLQFSVNGSLVGTTAVLANHGENSTSTDNWVRFYGSWTSGPTTTSAVIYINDQQTALSGNDFGIDDVSFGTLSTFVSLESADGTDAQTLCINTPITPIVYSVGSSASAPTITPALPAGLTSSFNGIQLTISGTPTIAGNFAYTITTTGTCKPSSATGTINVQTQKITLSSGSASPSVCINTPVSIGFTLSGTATGATTTGLPGGVTGSTSGSFYNFTGTPTVPGVYPYTITTTGTCTATTFSGTITVTSQTITLNTANAIQTICINSPISNIQYTVGGTGTGITSVTGLPAGVSSSFASGILSITGTPTTSTGSPFTYTITTSGTCSPVTASGTITVTPAASFTLTSASGTNTQTVCINSGITDITYAVNGGTGATASGLPAGVSGLFNAGVFTLSGTPTAAGTFNYTITTSGGCGAGTATGTITVQSQTITLASGSTSPTTCINTLMSPNIVYTIGGTASGASVTGLPAGLNGTLSGSNFTIGGTPTVSGSFPYTVTLTGSCSTTATASGTITVTGAATGGSLTSVSICSGTSGTLTLVGQVGTIVRWEYSTDGGSTWIPVSNTTISQTYPGLTAARQYRAVVTNGCGNVFSTVAFIGIHNLWTGATSTDWNTAGNWSDNQLPSISPCPDVLIPGGALNQPTLTGTSAIANIHIFPGATVTINGGTLQIAGTITNGGTFIAANGTIELNGGIPQTIPASAFQNNALNNLIISNTNATGVTLGGALDISGALTFSTNGKNLNTNDVLTLKSAATGTASVGNMTGHTINGDVTVERYIATGNTHAKSWQLLAIPTAGSIPGVNGQTIKASWQEGATVALNTTNGNNASTNPNPGYGTMLTSDVAGAATQSTPGFDFLTTPGPSIKVYNTLTDGYNGPASTALPIYNQKGYFILVRGDRSVFTSGGLAVSTVLRTKGTLFTPANLPPLSTVVANKFESVGNPYASAIDIRKISMDANINSTIIVWDPTLGIGSVYGLGAFQTLYLNGDGTNNGTNNYINLLTSTAYGTAGTINNNIQSGQAFIVQAYLPQTGP